MVMYLYVNKSNGLFFLFLLMICIYYIGKLLMINMVIVYFIKLLIYDKSKINLNVLLNSELLII